MVVDRAMLAEGVAPGRRRRGPGWAALIVVPVVVAVVVLGVWVTGGLISQDARTSMALTGGWFLLSGVGAAAVAARRRSLAWPLLGSWLVTVLGVGGFLFVTSTLDHVVHEKVVTAGASLPRTSTGSAAAATSGPTTSATTTAPAAASATPVLAASGPFRAQAHPTSGRAQLIDIDGRRVLTLTHFGTEPGPDVRVYLVPGDGSSVTGGVDLGGLKGNKGDQQYAVPPGAPTGAVVLWCRSFSVAFGTAALTS